MSHIKTEIKGADVGVLCYKHKDCKQSKVTDFLFLKKNHCLFELSGTAGKTYYMGFKCAYKMLLEHNCNFLKPSESCQFYLETPVVHNAMGDKKHLKLFLCHEITEQLIHKHS